MGHKGDGSITTSGETPREHGAVVIGEHVQGGSRKRTGLEAWLYWRPNVIKLNFTFGLEIDWDSEKRSAEIREPG
jgi:hypothetical protein